MYHFNHFFMYSYVVVSVFVVVQPVARTFSSWDTETLSY